MAIKSIRVFFRTARAGGKLISAVPYANVQYTDQMSKRVELDIDRITMQNYKGKAVGEDYFAIITTSDYLIYGEGDHLSGIIDRSVAGDIVMVDSDMLICLNGNLLAGYDMNGRIKAQNHISDSAVARIRNKY